MVSICTGAFALAQPGILELLENGTLTVEEVARRCGLGSTDNFRLYFRRHLRTTPSAYRRAFSSAAADHV
jgi:transcriptional regulator GlxA family with amidase domain